MKKTRGYVTPGAAGLIVFLGAMAAFTIALLLDAGKKADAHRDGEIKAETCPVQVTTACGDGICQYTAHVPCAELEELIKRNSRHDTE